MTDPFDLSTYVRVKCGQNALESESALYFVNKKLENASELSMKQARFYLNVKEMLEKS